MAADSWLTIMDKFLTVGDEKAEEKAEMKKKMLKLIDIYYDALDAPKNGAKVDLPDELKPDVFPHYMERDQKFKSTSILGKIYDFVNSQTAGEHTPLSGNEPFLYNTEINHYIIMNISLTVLYTIQKSINSHVSKMSRSLIFIWRNMDGGMMITEGR